MYGLYLARELHPEGMLYFSEEAHYSILKNASVLNMPTHHRQKTERRRDRLRRPQEHDDCSS